MASPYDVQSAFPLDKISMASLQAPNSNMLPGVPNAPPDLSQVTTDQLSPYGHIGDVLNQYVANKQQQQTANGLVQQILGMRFQPTQEDRMDAYNQNTASLYAPNTFKGTTPTEIATNRAQLELAPYTAAAKLQDASVASGGGATGALVNRYMADNPGSTFSDALYAVQTGFRQGQQRVNGVISNIPGVAPAKAQIAGAETVARDTATNTVKSQFSLPQIEDAAGYTTKIVDELVSDPALSSSVGLSSYMPVVRGTPRANFMSKLSQIQSQAFLEAFNTLRGGGQISNVEGEKATQALNRMSESQSEEGFKQAANDFKTIVNQAVIRTRNAAAGAPQAAGAPAVPMVGATHRYNASTGQLEVMQ